MRRPVSTKSVVTDHENNKNNPRKDNPNRLSWPGVRLSEDRNGRHQIPYDPAAKDAKGNPCVATKPIRFRILPEHETRNPNGYVQQIRYKVFMKGATKPTYIVSPQSLGDGSFCPYAQIREDFDQKFKEDKDFQDWWDSINMEVLKQGTVEVDPIAYRDATFKRDYLEFCKPWETFFIPAVLYATCDRRQVPGTKYEDLFNYRPDPKSFAPRLLELGNWKATTELIDMLLVEEDFDVLNGDDEAAIMDAPVRPNSPTHGVPMQMKRVKNGEKLGYEIEVCPGAGRSPLPKAIAEKLAPNMGPDDKNQIVDLHEHNYPDVLGWKVKKELKSNEDMQLALVNSTLGEVLIEKGILAVAKLAPTDFPDDDDNQDPPFDVD